MTPHNSAAAAVPGVGATGSAFARWLSEEREHIADRRFWVVQALVLLLAGLHVLAEGIYTFHERIGGVAHALYFMPEALFLIPVGYAALNFGLRGSVLTAVWCTLLTVPNLLTWHHGEQVAGTLLQLVILNVIAVFVGQRVDREVRARLQAEAFGRALHSSEARYRALFQTSSEAALVLDGQGVVRDANAAAARLFPGLAHGMKGARLADLVGARNAAQLDGGDGQVSTEFLHVTSDGRARHLQGTATMLPPQQEAETLVQLLLRDVTRERTRQDELRTYASHIVRAQEEERRRAGQELHDEVLQSLVILLRQLDTAEEGAAPAVAAQLRCARTKIEELIATVRRFAHRLRPPWLEDLGLVASVRHITRDAAARSGLDADVIVGGDVRRLPADTELGLFRIAQEAIVNVERHASARALRVSLRFQPEAVTMEIVDDGCGFDREAGRTRRIEHGNLGLVGMEERTALLGGLFRLTSAPGRGTSVFVSVATPAPH